ncbi:MAG: phosphatase [Oscillospiraceae bacterium]|nr:phosphatase [Oscillospiraceae bacterium]
MFIELDTHFHTVASTHAYSTVKEIAQSAAESGLKGFAMTDHAPSIWDAPHVWHFRNLKVIPDYICGVRVIRGVEANITDFEGNIDMSDFDLEFVDWVVASYHSVVVDNTEKRDCTDSYIRLAKNNPCVDVIGHAGDPHYPFDMEKAFKVFKEYEKYVEINESALLHKKGSMELNAEMLRICKKLSVPVVVNTDGHYCDLVGRVPCAEKLIEETGFPKELVANSCADRIFEHIRTKHADFI